MKQCKGCTNAVLTESLEYDCKDTLEDGCPKVQDTGKLPLHLVKMNLSMIIVYHFEPWREVVSYNQVELKLAEREDVRKVDLLTRDGQRTIVLPFFDAYMAVLESGTWITIPEFMKTWD